MSQGGGIMCLGLVRRDGKPFVKVEVAGNDFGQLTPTEAVNMGTRFIMAGIEAERDAGVVRGMLDKGSKPDEINELLTLMRKYRDSCDPDPKGSIFHPRFPS